MQKSCQMFHLSVNNMLFDKNAGGYCVCQKKVVNLQRDLWKLRIEN